MSTYENQSVSSDQPAVRAQRLLQVLVRDSADRSWAVFRPVSTARELGLLVSEVQLLARQLETQGLIEYPPFGSLVHVTPAGHTRARSAAPIAPTAIQ